MASSHEVILVSRVYPIGKQSLVAVSCGRFYVRLENRTYSTEVEIPPTKVLWWLNELKGGR